MTLAGLVLVSALEPTDTIAVTAFQQNIESARISTLQNSRQDIEAGCWRVIERRPLDPQPWRQLGDWLVAWKRSDEALQAYGQAVHRGDDAAAFDKSMARLSANFGDQYRAARHLAKYLARRPDDRAARLTLAQTNIQRGDWSSASAALEQLLADEPTDPEAHAWLGLLLIDADPASGRPHLQRAAEDPVLAAFLAPVFSAERTSLANDDPVYRSALLGVSFLDLDVSNLRQPSASHSAERGWATEKELNKTTATLALRSLLAAVRHNPIYADAYAYIGQSADQLGWSDWALASLRYALQLAPESPVVQTLMGLYWDRHGSPSMARHYYELALSHNTDNAALYLEIAATYSAEDEYTAAEIWLLLAAEIAPDDLQIWKTLSHFYLDSGIGVEESGLVAATRLLELAPNDAQAHDMMGWAFFLTNKNAEAQASLTQALNLDPTLASAYYHLGRLYARQGHHAEAIQNYRRAADLDTRGELAAELDRAWDHLNPSPSNGP